MYKKKALFWFKNLFQPNLFTTSFCVVHLSFVLIISSDLRLGLYLLFSPYEFYQHIKLQFVLSLSSVINNCWE